MSSDQIEPIEVVCHVEQYVEYELRDVKQFSNRALLDESGVWSLHRLAAEIYAMGYRAGDQAAAERGRKARSREQAKAVTE
ncbi:hypothetical protein [Nocardia sp. NPDC060249]|uniref:hypothetical protein n=1 Tax=Nocardia sp. NPDC060249 TaxID=3347082 RepID=UPI00364D2A89